MLFMCWWLQGGFSFLYSPPYYGGGVSVLLLNEINIFPVSRARQGNRAWWWLELKSCASVLDEILWIKVGIQILL